jgi:serine/threonine protein kinase
VATGLQFLHEQQPTPFAHGSLTAHNVLLTTSPSAVPASSTEAPALNRNDAPSTDGVSVAAGDQQHSVYCGAAPTSTASCDSGAAAAISSPRQQQPPQARPHPAHHHHHHRGRELRALVADWGLCSVAGMLPRPALQLCPRSGRVVRVGVGLPPQHSSHQPPGQQQQPGSQAAAGMGDHVSDRGGVHSVLAPKPTVAVGGQQQQQTHHARRLQYVAPELLTTTTALQRRSAEPGGTRLPDGTEAQSGGVAEAAASALALPADVYALGVLIAEVLAGRLLIRAEAVDDEGEVEGGVVVAAMSGCNVAGKLPSGLPAALVQLVERCCASEPESRPTAREVVVHLEACLSLLGP